MWNGCPKCPMARLNIRSTALGLDTSHATARTLSTSSPATDFSVSASSFTDGVLLVQQFCYGSRRFGGTVLSGSGALVYLLAMLILKRSGQDRNPGVRSTETGTTGPIVSVAPVFYGRKRHSCRTSAPAGFTSQRAHKRTGKVTLPGSFLIRAPDRGPRNGAPRCPEGSCPPAIRGKPRLPWRHKSSCPRHPHDAGPRPCRHHRQSS